MAGLHDLGTEEAHALFSVPRICEEIEDWLPQKQQPNTWKACCGVLNAVDRSSAGLLVQLVYRKGQKSGGTWIQLTVFKRNVWGNQRAYQLDVEQYARKLPLHDLPHEHFGNERIAGSSDWSTWTFAEALQHFSCRTKITFQPPVADPQGSFQLKGQR